MENKISKTVDIQLSLLEKKREQLIKDIYKFYSIYLDCIRDNINISIKNGLLSLVNKTSQKVIKSVDKLFDGTDEISVEDGLIEDFYSGKDVSLPEQKKKLFPNYIVPILFTLLFFKKKLFKFFTFVNI